MGYGSIGSLSYARSENKKHYHQSCSTSARAMSGVLLTTTRMRLPIIPGCLPHGPVLPLDNQSLKSHVLKAIGKTPIDRSPESGHPVRRKYAPAHRAYPAYRAIPFFETLLGLPSGRPVAPLGKRPQHP